MFMAIVSSPNVIFNVISSVIYFLTGLLLTWIMHKIHNRCSETKITWNFPSVSFYLVIGMIIGDIMYIMFFR
jgi:hypothetical protein